jgi:hypothetical protein
MGVRQVGPRLQRGTIVCGGLVGRAEEPIGFAEREVIGLGIL